MKQDLKQFMIEEASLGLNDGPMFGPGGANHQRMNIATSRGVLRSGLEQLASAVARSCLTILITSSERGIFKKPFTSNYFELYETPVFILTEDPFALPAFCFIVFFGFFQGASQRGPGAYSALSIRSDCMRPGSCGSSLLVKKASVQGE